MYDNARSGAVHSIPLSTNFKILKHFNLAASANYREVWQPKTIRYNDYDPIIDGVKKDTVSQFSISNLQLWSQYGHYYLRDCKF